MRLLPIILFLLLSGFASARNLTIHCLDVGEGDALLLQCGAQTILVDSGNLLSGPTLVSYLQNLKIRRLDYFLLTHPHPDHIGGTFFVLPRFQVGHVYDNGQNILNEKPDADLKRWYQELVRGHSNYQELRAGTVLKPCTNLALQVLWPPEKLSFRAFNPNSLVIQVVFGKFRMLLAGDLLREAEPTLLALQSNLKSQVLKMGHHGSRHATSSRFLEAVAPRVVLVSVDAGNRNGYPDEERLLALAHQGVGILRTDQHGTIVLRAAMDGSFTVATERGENQ